MNFLNYVLMFFPDLNKLTIRPIASIPAMGTTWMSSSTSNGKAPEINGWLITRRHTLHGPLLWRQGSIYPSTPTAHTLSGISTLEPSWGLLAAYYWQTYRSSVWGGVGFTVWEKVGGREGEGEGRSEKEEEREWEREGEEGRWRGKEIEGEVNWWGSILVCMCMCLGVWL